MFERQLFLTKQGLDGNALWELTKKVDWRNVIPFGRIGHIKGSA